MSTLASHIALVSLLATASPAAATGPEVAAPATTAVATTAVATAAAVDVVLPCGLRVLAARDASLPVAAVILAIEVGSEDDPAELPGLVHALAYHAGQGNRELRPGEAIAVAHDAGGVHRMTTGPAQLRFETIVPAPRLDAVLWLETQRLRWPTTSLRRWEQSLGWAASDEQRPSRLSPEALAFIHGTPGLAHEGRATSKALATMVEGALAAQIRDKLHYARATLVVVSPDQPDAVVDRVQALLADLPQATRAVPHRSIGPRTPPPSPSEAPAKPEEAPEEAPDVAPENPEVVADATHVTVPLARQRGHTFAWPVAPTPAANAWAAALCRAVNRQRKAPEPTEPRRARLSCELEADPRRGVLLLRPVGTPDPWALVTARLARLGPGGSDAGLLQEQAKVVAQALQLAMRTPQGLAQQLTRTAVTTAPAVAGNPQVAVLEDLTGLAALADDGWLTREAPAWLRAEDAVVLVHPQEAR